jgi:predicted permease
VLLQLALFFAFLALGLVLQLLGAGDRLRGRVWIASFWLLTPLIVFVTFLRIHPHRGLLLALGAAMLASWLVIGLSYAYAYAVSAEHDERGALVLGSAFGNTGFLGYPLAHLAYGAPGFTLAVLYDRLALVFPMTSVSTAIARLHGRQHVDVARDQRLRAILLNPPAWALVVAVALRLAHVHVPSARLNHALALVVGPFGFLLLGLALPLDRIEHRAEELGRASGALVIKFALSPLVLWICGRALGAHIPRTFYLMAAMPVAFHLLILARVYNVRPALMRLLVVGSTVPGVIAVAIGVALTR